jgi:hypothetical protein
MDQLCLASTLDGGEWTLMSRPVVPWERALCTHWIGKLGVLRAGMDAAEKNLLSLKGMNPAVKPVGLN